MRLYITILVLQDVHEGSHLTVSDYDTMRREFYDQLYQEQDPGFELEMHEPSDSIFWLSQNMPRGATVFDIGGGNGITAVWLADMGYAVTMVDESEPGVQRARELALAVGVANRVSAVLGDVRQGFLPGVYDAVIMSRVLHDLSYDEAVALMDSMRQATKPGGYHVVELCLIGVVEIPEMAGHFVPLSAQALLDMYTEAGWEIEGADETMCCVHPILSAVFRRPPE